MYPQTFPSPLSLMAWRVDCPPRAILYTGSSGALDLQRTPPHVQPKTLLPEKMQERTISGINVLSDTQDLRASMRSCLVHDILTEHLDFADHPFHRVCVRARPDQAPPRVKFDFGHKAGSSNENGLPSRFSSRGAPKSSIRSSAHQCGKPEPAHQGSKGPQPNEPEPAGSKGAPNTPPPPSPKQCPSSRGPWLRGTRRLSCTRLARGIMTTSTSGMPRRSAPRTVCASGTGLRCIDTLTTSTAAAWRRTTWRSLSCFTRISLWHSQSKGTAGCPWHPLCPLRPACCATLGEDTPRGT